MLHVSDATGLLCGAVQPLLAGMPTAELSEWGELRLQTISFFLLGFLISSLVVWRIWNSLRRDFPRLPQLSIGKASGLVLLWGLLFIVVLTMISGARELMTPGAWEKQGATYKLKSTPKVAQPSAPNIDQSLGRKDRIARLKSALWQFAAEHDGQFPTTSQASTIPDVLWLIDEQTGLRFVYVPGNGKPEPERPLAYEPQIVDGRPWVLLSNGEIEQRDFDTIASQIATEKAP